MLVYIYRGVQDSEVGTTTGVYTVYTQDSLNMESVEEGIKRNECVQKHKIFEIK
jgi:hypothetical protein